MSESARSAEKAKYIDCYASPNYRMGGKRMTDAQGVFASVEGESYLDVGCGRGEMLDFAESKGFSAQGVETVPALVDGNRVILGDVFNLPFADNSFDVVGFWDVIEHLLPGDEIAACNELQRVAKRTILLTANNRPSFHKGVNLHINIRPYEEWHEIFCEVFDGRVEWIPERRYFSQIWRIEL